MLTSEQLYEIKKLRARYPQLDLQSARKTIEDGYFILYVHNKGELFWSHKAAIEYAPPLGEQIKWKFVPYSKGVQILEIIKNISTFYFRFKWSDKELAQYVRLNCPNLNFQEKTMVFREVIKING